jgi:hypothetical protein
VILGDREFGVRATLVTGAERDRLWRKLAQIWPGYDSYAARARSREIRIFRLTPED